MTSDQVKNETHPARVPAGIYPGVNQNCDDLFTGCGVYHQPNVGYTAYELTKNFETELQVNSAPGGKELPRRCSKMSMVKFTMEH